jgi:hypothetical protein
MKPSVFLSYPTPCFASQQKFIQNLIDLLLRRGLQPRTVGVTDYDMDAPLKSIRRLLLECNGLITIAFRRTYIENGAGKYRTDLDGLKEIPIHDKWVTSPWAQIEPSMAYQLGLPILILRESKVLDEGILEKGIIGIYMPEFDLDSKSDYFDTVEWSDMIAKWDGYVRRVVDQKGNPSNIVLARSSIAHDTNILRFADLNICLKKL